MGLKKTIIKLWFIGLLVIFLLPLSSFDAFAEHGPSHNIGGAGVEGATGEAAAEVLASSPSECTTTIETIDGKQTSFTPRNCFFLDEPIGGRPGIDLFTEECAEQPDGSVLCVKELWRGGPITGNTRGPIQAILTFEPGKPYQGPFGLLYNYLGLIYGYMSGLIIGIAVLFVVVGGIQMTTAAGDPGRFQAGRDRIIKALIGMVLWFTASLILYTINPTFFTF